ncbi:MAG: transcription elongation factor GreA [Dehalococcoidia bacterium]|nr:MAG: transcription elongation factor GreA [Dehalococcoidia bacterium]
MVDKPVFLTPEGRSKLEAELEYLRREKRRQITERISESKEIGGFGDNADLDDARNEQAIVETRIQQLERMLRTATIIKEHDRSQGVVQIGSTVTVVGSDGEEETYTIVGSAEANPRAGKISNESPVGHALLGRKVGDVVQVMTPSGVEKLTVRLIE